MTDHSQRRRSTSDSRGVQCHAIIEKSDDQPTLCTIYSTAPDDSILTTWISAEAGAFDFLEDRR
ncbi:MAG: hypothetical protein R6V31_09085 [Halohasta sp.]